MKWTNLLSLAAVAGALTALGCTDADPLSSAPEAGDPAARLTVSANAVGGSCEMCRPFPDFIRLPEGFGPEGIAVGNGSTFYVGSLTPPTLGQVLVGDLRTGHFTELVAPTGKPALGIKYEARSDLIFVAGANSRTGRVYNARSGAEVASYTFGEETSVINDVVLTRSAAYFTDHANPALYRVALDASGRPGAASTIPLPENFGATGGCAVSPPLKSNGAAATADGRFLILAHMSEGKLYRVNTATHAVEPIALSGGDVCSADGLLLDGQRLYAVQNIMHRVAVVDLAPDFLSGTVSRHITEPFASHPLVKVPTTIAMHGESLYAVTAGFAPPAPDCVVRLSK